MATISSTTIQPIASTAALFRAWAQFVHDTFALAWTQTSDTGQINLTTVSAPGAASTKMGYEIWKMADALQSTAPVFIRIDYGSAAFSTAPGIYISIGTGSDGAGNLTGIMVNNYASGGPVAGCQGSTTAFNSYGSADTNRITVCIASDSTSYAFGFSIERTKDSSGADDDTGVIWGTISNHSVNRPSNLTGTSTIGTTYSTLHYAPFAGPQPPYEAGWLYILANSNPSAFASDIGVGLVIPVGTVAKQPGTNLAVCRTSDFALNASPTITIYGGSVTYLRIGHNPSIGVNNTVTRDSTAAVLMRYE